MLVENSKVFVINVQIYCQWRSEAICGGRLVLFQ